MFYSPGVEAHGLPHDPIKSCVIPRPIGWITTLSASGVVNLAPYSYFNLVADQPAMVAYASCGNTPHGHKDTVTNIQATCEFVVNVATWGQREAMRKTSEPLPPDVDELAEAGLGTLPSRRVRPPRVAGAPIHLECEHYRTIELPHADPEGRNALVLGTVVGVHVDDRVLVDGKIDVARIQPIARLGYLDYACVSETFSMRRPTKA